jgi:hypothetical protein
MLRDKGRQAADDFLSVDGGSIGTRSMLHIDRLLENV